MLLFSLAERGPYTAKILHFRKNRNFKDFVKIILRIIQKKVWQETLSKFCEVKILQRGQDIPKNCKILVTQNFQIWYVRERECK